MDLTWNPGQSLLRPVAELSQVGDARRTAAMLARRIGATESRASNLAIITTELARNMVIHGGGGKLIFHPFFQGRQDALNGSGSQSDGASDDAMAGIDILALDLGPGIRDLSRAMQDGYSTQGTPGNGMGALDRLSDKLDIYSKPGQGTAVLCRVYAKGPIPAPSRPRPTSPAMAALSIAKPGEIDCGDHWTFKAVEDGCQVLVVDGLGHGPEASLASHKLTELFDRLKLKPAEMFRHGHEQLRQTRGAAAGLAYIKAAQSQIEYWCVGNIAGSIISADEVSSLVGQHGTVGLAMPAVRPMPYRLERRSLLVLTSDGVKSRWNLDDYPGLLKHDPALIAGIIFRDYARGTDDTTIVVVPLSPHTQASRTDFA